MPDDLRLQVGPLTTSEGRQNTGRLRFNTRFRFVRENGYTCQHWHYTVESAAECLHRRARPERRAA